MTGAGYHRKRQAGRHHWWRGSPPPTAVAIDSVAFPASAGDDSAVGRVRPADRQRNGSAGFRDFSQMVIQVTAGRDGGL